MSFLVLLQGLTRLDTLPFVYGAFFVTIPTIFYLWFQPAPYGKFTPASGVLQLLQINGKIAWFIQECPAFFIPIHILAIYWRRFSFASNLSLALFSLHYFQRSFIYPILMTSGRKTPLSACSSAFIFCCFNGWLQSKAIKEIDGVVRNSVLSSVGVGIFFIGMYLNFTADAHLRDLARRRNDGQYLIPTAGLFKFVSAANYTGEIIEWIGFAMVTQTLASTWFAVFTALFLGQRGYQSHQFYLKKIDDYPKTRSSVIPFAGF